MRNQGWRKAWWIALVCMAALLVGAVIREVMLRPRPAQIKWQYPLNITQSFTQILSQDNGSLILNARDDIICLDSQGKMRWSVAAPKTKHFRQASCPINQRDSQGNLYVCAGDEVWSIDRAGEIRWKVALEAHAGASARTTTSRAATCRVSRKDQILVVYNTDEAAVISTTGEVEKYFVLPFDTFIGAVPLETEDQRYIFGIMSANNKANCGLAITDRDGSLIKSIATPCHIIEYIELYDNMLVVLDGESQVYGYSIEGKQQWHYSSKSTIEHHLPVKPIELGANRNLLMCIDSPDYSRVSCIDLTGKHYWSVKQRGIMRIAAQSENVQYLVAFEEPKRAFQQYIARVSPALAQTMYEHACWSLLVQVTNGRITKRWELPFEPWLTLGCAKEGEVYISSLMDGALFCIDTSE